MQSDTQKLNKSIRLVLSHYLKQARLNPWLTSLLMILPGIGNILIFYVPTLIIAQLIARVNESTTALELGVVMPYILLFAGAWFIGEMVWRLGLQVLAAFESQTLRRLNKDALDHLLDKDQRFFSENFTGSLTKKTLAYSRSFEALTDTLFFSVFASLIPMVFAGVVLWQFSPWIVLALFGMIAITLTILVPLIKRRRKLVLTREIAHNALS